MTKHKIDLGLTAYDELFGDVSDVGYLEVPLNQIDSYFNHRCKKLNERHIAELVESIKRNEGVLSPVVLREKADGRYECLSGHHRIKAYEILGLKTIRAEIKDLDDVDAAIVVGDYNLQRDLSISEKAWTLRDMMDALKIKAGRPTKNYGQNVHNFDGRTSRDIIGEKIGESGKTVARYIRLTYLIPALLDMMDDKKIIFMVGVELSYLTAEQQMMVLKFMEKTGARPSLEQAQKLHVAANNYELDEDKIFDIFVGKRKSPAGNGKDAYKRICDAVPKTVPADKTEDFIVTAIKYYVKHSNTGW